MRYKLLSNDYCAVFLWLCAVNPNILHACIRWRSYLSVLQYEVVRFIPCFVIVGWMQVFRFTPHSVLPRFTLYQYWTVEVVVHSTFPAIGLFTLLILSTSVYRRLKERTMNECHKPHFTTYNNIMMHALYALYKIVQVYTYHSLCCHC